MKFQKINRWCLLFLSCFCIFCPKAFSNEIGKLHALNAEDITFGQKQLALMLMARPKMKELVTQNSNIGVWCARQFGGESTGSRSEWKSDRTDADAKKHFASHQGPFGASPGWISVQAFDQDGYAASAEQLWAGAIYEFLNAKNDFKFLVLTRKALSRQISKNEFALSCAELEFAACKELAEFYKKFWAPQMKLSPDKTASPCWYVGLPDSYVKAKKLNLSVTSSEQTYRDFYDAEILPKVQVKEIQPTE